MFIIPSAIKKSKWYPLAPLLAELAYLAVIYCARETKLGSLDVQGNVWDDEHSGVGFMDISKISDIGRFFPSNRPIQQSLLSGKL